MLTQFLRERFDQLLGFAKSPNYALTANENIAAARELIDTAHILDCLSSDEYLAYQAQVRTARQVVGAAKLKRCDDAIRAAQDGWTAYPKGFPGEDHEKPSN